MERNARTKKLKIAIIAIALLLCFALAVGITTAFYQAQRRAMGSVKMDQGIIIDYKGFNKGDENIWQREATTTFKLFEERDAQPGEQIYAYPAGIRANAESVDFYARLKLEYSFYNVVGDVETKVALANPKSLIKTSNDFFASNWVPSTDGYYYYGVDTTLSKFSKDATNYIDIFAKDGEGNVVAKFLIEGANFVGETAGEGGGFVAEGTYINKIVVLLTLETLQGDADAEAEGWKITQPSGETVDVSGETETDININDIIDEDLKDGEITITGDPVQQLTITIGSKAFYGCTKLKLTLSNSENIIYQIASDAFSSGATIMYGLDNVTSLLVDPSTSGKSEGVANRWKVSEPNLYLFLPTGLTSTSSSYGDYQYTDDQGTWYFDLIDKRGNKVSALSSRTSGGVSTLGASTLESTTDYTARINVVLCNENLVNMVIPKYVSTSVDGQNFLVTILNYGRTGSGIHFILNSTEINDFKSIKFPSSLKKIGDYSFEGLRTVESIDLSNTHLTTIPERAFAGCSSLTTVLFPSSVSAIYAEAFHYCNITELNLPNLNYLNSLAFGGNNLNSVFINEKNENFYVEGNCLISKSGTVMIGTNNSVIPTDKNITTIAAEAFNGREELTYINIPNGITTLGKGAFANCKKLSRIELPDTVTEIGAGSYENYYTGTFEGCYELKSIVLSKNIKTIPLRCFMYCGFTSIDLPESVTNIAGHAFWGSALVSITIPNSVTTIEREAFDACENLNSLTIGSKIGNFSWVPTPCTGLRIVDSNPYAYTDGYALFSKKTGNVLYLDKYISKQSNYRIPSSITIDEETWKVELNERCFEDNDQIVSVTISDGITLIPSCAFQSCSNLTTVIIPNSVITIDSSAFSNCRKITAINLPEGLLRIGSSVFYNTGLESIVLPNSLLSLADRAFSFCQGLRNIIIPEGITEIPRSCFSLCKNLQEITIPSTCTIIGDSAFSDCSNLTSIKWNISYDLNGVNATGPELSQLEGRTIDGLTITDILEAAPTDIENGLVFEGWTDGTTIYQPGVEYTFSLGNRRLEAVWSMNKVSFDANGGTGSLDSVIFEKNETVTVPEFTNFARDGFITFGWSTEKTDKTAKYKPGDTFTPDGSCILYIIWQKPVQVIFEANGGQGAGELLIQAQGQESFSLSDYNQIYHKEGYYIIGWGYSTDYKDYEADDTFNFYNENFQNQELIVKLYAIWKAYYKVTLDGNNGLEEIYVVDQTDPSQGTFKLSDYTNQFTAPENMYLAGWAKTANATEPYWRLSETIYFSSWNKSTFYAVWKEYEKVTLDSNNGSGETILVERNQNVSTLSFANYADAFTAPENCYLVGWSTNKDATTATWSATGSVAIASYNGQTIYAIWKIIPAITLNSNNGEQVEYIKKTEVDSRFLLTSYSNLFVRDSYVLKGWSLTENSTSIDYTINSWVYFSSLEGKTLYAVWQKLKTITFNVNGGAGENITITQSSTSDSYVHIDGDLWLSSNENVTFKGWAKEQTATEPNYTQDSTVWYSDFTEDDIILYAVWQERAHLVLVANNGTDETIKAYIDGEEYGYIYLSNYTNTFTAPGEDYYLLGWAWSSTATSTDKSKSDSIYLANYSSENGRSLYAVWKKYKTVTINSNGGTGEEITVKESAGTTQIWMGDYVDSFVAPKGQVLAGWDTNKESSSPRWRKTYYIPFSSLSETTTIYAIWAEPTNTITFSVGAYNAFEAFMVNQDYNAVQAGLSFSASIVIYDTAGNLKASYSCSQGLVSATLAPGDYIIRVYGFAENVINIYTADSLYNNLMNGVGLTKNDSYTITLGTDDTGAYSQINFTLVYNAENDPLSGSNASDYGSMLFFAGNDIASKTVTFNANGGQSTIESMSTFGTTLELPARSKFTYEGKFLVGFSKSQDTLPTDSSNIIDPGSTYTLESDNDTLYAIWVNLKTITIKANGGTGEDLVFTQSTDSMWFYPGDRYDYSFEHPDGLGIIGWATDPTGTNQFDYRNGINLNQFEENNVIIYAIWG